MVTTVVTFTAEATLSSVAALTTEAAIIAVPTLTTAKAPVTGIAALATEASVITIAAITSGATITPVSVAASIAIASTILKPNRFCTRWPAAIGVARTLGGRTCIAAPALAVSLGGRRASEGSFAHTLSVEVGDAHGPCRTRRGRRAGCGIAGGALDAKGTAWPRGIVHGGLR
ncbi:hypothetical protein [Imbroritus primus]|uniref:hypothetical protein n=1 Tax=Imbroritus primus TaxID=3058603 RepID=UPI003D16210F